MMFFISPDQIKRLLQILSDSKDLKCKFLFNKLHSEENLKLLLQGFFFFRILKKWFSSR